MAKSGIYRGSPLGPECQSVDVSNGSIASFRPPSDHFRSFPMSRHSSAPAACLKRATNRRRRRAYIRYPSCLECVASPRTAEDLAPVIFKEGDWNGEGWSTLRSCTLPTTRPTLYAEWTDIELVRELSPGRAEVPVSYWQRRCHRQASHFNRPMVFLAGAFSHSQSHGRAIQHDLFAVTREKRHEDSLFSDIGDAGGLRTRCSRG